MWQKTDTTVKNRIDMPIFHRLICAENITISSDPTRETAFAAFSCGFSNASVRETEGCIWMGKGRRADEQKK